METKASHLLIGGFVLIIVAGVFAFVTWLAKLEIDREFSRYLIVFEGSVTGLSRSSDVLYNGIPVGSVAAIEIDPADPSRVRVTVEVAGATPIRADSIATLELKGITGVSQVQITGGTPGSPPPQPLPGEKIPVIASNPSPFQELFTGAPEAINRFILLVDRATKFLDEGNREAIGQILDDARVLTGSLASRSDNFAALVDDLQATSSDLRAASASVGRIAVQLESVIESADQTLAVARGTMAGVDQLIDDDVRRLVADARTMARSLTQTSDQLGKLIADNREPFNEFSSEGLLEFARLVTEMRDLVESLTRLAGKIESDPARFIFGDAQQGFEAR